MRYLKPDLILAEDQYVAHLQRESPVIHDRPLAAMSRLPESPDEMARWLENILKNIPQIHVDVQTA